MFPFSTLNKIGFVMVPLNTLNKPSFIVIPFETVEQVMVVGSVRPKQSESQGLNECSLKNAKYPAVLLSLAHTCCKAAFTHKVAEHALRQRFIVV